MKTKNNIDFSIQIYIYFLIWKSSNFSQTDFIYTLTAVVVINQITFESEKSLINPFTYQLFKFIHLLVVLNFKL